MKRQPLQCHLFTLFGPINWVMMAMFAISSFPNELSETHLGAQEASDTKVPLATTIAVNSFQTTQRDRNHSKHSIQFGDTKCAITQELSKTRHSFSSMDIGLRNVRFGYRRVHPENHLYGTLGIQGGFMTEDRWIWKGLAKIEVPTKTVWNISSDSRCIFGLETAYAFDDQWSAFLGVGAETGMRATCVNPIVGAQYIYKDWIFHAVYPNPRIIYRGIKRCQFSLNMSSFFTAVRSRKVEHHKKGVALLKGCGTELRIDYAFSKKMNGWLSAGTLFPARVTVGNKNFHHKKHHSIDPEMYGQIGFSYAL